MIKQQLGEILQKEMDRKEFLRHIGVAAAAIIGIPTVMRALSQLNNGRPSSNTQRVSAGYGTSPYGGASK